MVCGLTFHRPAADLGGSMYVYLGLSVYTWGPLSAAVCCPCDGTCTNTL